MARRNIVERYSRADVGKRVEIILDNYGIVTGQLSVLQKEEYDLYLPYINGEKGCFEIAADEGILQFTIVNICPSRKICRSGIKEALG